jgi:rod shape-determining protein MreC
MFSRQMVLIAGVVALAAATIIALSFGGRMAIHGGGGIGIAAVAPFQKAVTLSLRVCRDIWHHYFSLVNTVRENDFLVKALQEANARSGHFAEIQMANQRLRNLLSFQKTVQRQMIAAEVVATDPSPWFKSVMIDKGRDDGLRRGLPVVVAEGVVGQVVDVSAGYAKVLLVIDRNHAVDGLVQRTRARGVVKGDPAGRCNFEYLLRKYDVQVGDVVVTSGLDGVFPKGLPVGRVADVALEGTGIFQQVTAVPFVDFETLEEVLVLLSPSSTETYPKP